MSFDMHDDLGQGLPNGSKQGGGSTLRIVAILGLSCFVACCGFAGVGYVVLLRAVGTSIAMPERSGFDQDAALYNRSLANLNRDPCAVDPEVCEFVRQVLADARDGQEIPFNENMFIEATAASPESKGDFNIVNRLAIKASIAQFLPTPDEFESFERILDVRLHESGGLATVDLLFYSLENQANSQQWFLAKRNDRWEMYDWQRMEYGRRTSDEYAAYAKGNVTRTHGYDIAMQKIYAAQQQWLNGEQEQARRALIATERIPMLEQDRPVALLRTAYTWLSLGEDKQALRVLSKIAEPDALWGVWPVIAQCQLNVGDYEAALVAAERARKLSPDHPNVQTLLSVIYADTDRDDEAAAANTAALRSCPLESTLFNQAVNYGRVEDIPLLIDIASAHEQNQYWSQLVAAASYQAEWGRGLETEVGKRDDLPAGIAELVSANLGTANGDRDTATRGFLAAAKVSDQSWVQEIAFDGFVEARLSENRFEEMLEESADVEATLRELVVRAFSDELYCDEDRLLAALQEQTALAENVWRRGLSGWVHALRGDTDAAIEDTEVFCAWLTKNQDSLGDDGWLLEAAAYELSHQLLVSGRPLEVVERWPDDPGQHAQIAPYFLRNYRPRVMEQFLAEAGEHPADSVQLQILQIKARQAAWLGDASACDGFHRQAIELAEKLDADTEMRQAPGMLDARGVDLVRNRFFELDTSVGSDREREQRNSTLRSAARQAVLLDDPEAMQEVLQLADRWGLAEGDDFASLYHQAALLERQRGEWDRVATLLKKAFQASDPESVWYRRVREQLLVEALIELGRFDEARECLVKQDAQPDQIPADAMIDLAAGQEAALREKLSKFDTDAISTWIESIAGDGWVERSRDLSLLLALCKEHAVSPRYLGGTTSGTLVLKDATPFHRDAIETLLAATLADSFQVAEIPQSQTKGQPLAWSAVSSTGQRLAVTWSPREYDVSQLPEGLRESFQGTTGALSIAVLDRFPQADRRLFAIARGAAEKQAIAFSWRSGAEVWTGPDLEAQLAWENRVPMGPQVRPIQLITRHAADSEATPDPLGVDDWKRRLALADGPLRARLAVRCPLFSEWIPCELVAAEASGYQLRVRPTEASQLDPFVRQGIEYTVFAGSLAEVD